MVQESVEFRGEPLTVRQVERVVESQVIVLLNEITADSRAAAAEGACVADAAPGSPPVLQFREDCNVAVSADDLLVDTEPITEAGAALSFVDSLWERVSAVGFPCLMDLGRASASRR